ncbi:hypothetical protein COU59_03830 [Candidatus Pacearchaeota archaeon CG10_big_fil_rev_8_21_14_0_10_34_12]|nr:MAG: hypothetical protein COU59_03830 [Candidatus Pacearchaeota archaeon CG10_big_fil_rev_8_21_14_0_10_34_12]
MINKNEFFTILLVTLILAFTFSIVNYFGDFVYVFVSVLIIISANTLAKKVSSFYLDSEIEIKLWELKRYGFKPGWHFKKPFPAGAFLPVIVAAFTLGYVKWMASLVFEVKSKIYRTAKRFGFYSFSEVTEFHMALIASSGIVINLLLGIAGYFAGFDNFAKLNIYYAFFNVLPLSDLDGNKIFFGNIILWSFLASICLLGLFYVFLVV